MVEKGYKPYEGRDDVDPRLDNRTGSARPPLENDPAVPQQIDGPDLLGQEAHAEAVREMEARGDIPRKGMFSPGDHGLGDLDARDRGAGDVDRGQGGDALETDPGNPASAPTDASAAADAVLASPGSASNAPAGVKDTTKSDTTTRSDTDKSDASKSDPKAKDARR